MNKCEHNQNMNLFCVSQHCQWKQAAGCETCMQKHHNHLGNSKPLNEEQVESILKRLVIDQSSKPNYRPIQQSLYKYFGTLKNQITNSIQVMCKTFITKLGSSYLFRNSLFTVHKKVKNKEYRRINPKQFRMLFQLSNRIQPTQLAKQQGSMYRQQLRKDQRFLRDLQNIMTSYQLLLKQLLKDFKHERTGFNNLNHLMSQTSQNPAMTTHINQFHQKQMQKNRAQRTEKLQKVQKNQLRKVNTTKDISTVVDAPIKPSIRKQKQGTEEVSATKKEESKLQPNNNHKFGVKDIQILQKSHDKKQPSKPKRQISLQNKIFVNSSLQLTKEKKKVQIALIDDYKIQNQKRRIYINNTKTDFMADFFSESSKKYQTRYSKANQKKQLTTKQSEISMRKEQLIQMMKNHSATFRNNQKVKSPIRFEKNSEFDSPILKLNTQTQSQQENHRIPFKLQTINSVYENDSSGKRKASLVVQERKMAQSAQCKLESIGNSSSTYKNDSVKRVMSSVIQQKKMAQSVQSRPQSIGNSYSTYKYDSPDRRNVSVVIQQKKMAQSAQSRPQSPEDNSNSTFKNGTHLKRITSLVTHQKRMTQSVQSRLQSVVNSAALPKWQVRSINNINTWNQEQQQGCLQLIKNISAQNNMCAYSRLPIQNVEELHKQIGRSRLIIVPTDQKSMMDRSQQCESALARGKMVYLKKLSIQSGLKFQLNSKKQSPTKPQKSQLRQNEQKSLNLLIKAISLPTPQAIAMLELSMKQAPNNLSAAEYLSFLYIENDKPRQALTVCNVILDKFQIVAKQDQSLLVNLENNKSAALNALGRYSEAIIILLRCLKVKQKDTLLKNLGDAYYFNSNYEKAVFYYQKTLRLNPNHDEACYNMSVCLYLQNNFQNAKPFILRALQIAPRNADYLQLKKQLYDRINNQTVSFKNQ